MANLNPGDASSVEPATTQSSLGEAARADRAQRVAAMLDRWAGEDCSDEPDWDVDAIEPLRLGALPADVAGEAP